MHICPACLQECRCHGQDEYFDQRFDTDHCVHDCEIEEMEDLRVRCPKCSSVVSEGESHDPECSHA